MIKWIEGQPPLEELRKLENILVIIDHTPLIAFARRTYDKTELLEFPTWERVDEESVTRWAHINIENIEPEEKYYFISYMYGTDQKNSYNGLIEIHPLDWQAEHENSHPGQYVLNNWKEVTQQEYETYAGEVYEC